MQAKSPGLPANHHPIADILDIGSTVLQLENITQDRLATVSTGGIADLIGILDIIGSHVKGAQQKAQGVLTVRYAAQARAQLRAEGKDTGTTHILDGECDISVEIGKDVKYEPNGLAELVSRIEASGGDPLEFVEIKYSVPERKYQSWPKNLREPFERLRTVTPKAPRFTIQQVEEGGR